MKDKLGIARWGVLLALVTLLYGYGLGMTFGGAEEQLKAKLAAGGATWVEAQVSNSKSSTTAAGLAKVRAKAESDSAKVVEKSWIYMKRAHLHANGLGTSALALIMLLALSGASDRRLRFTALALGLGALGYSSFWMFAGFMAPELGSTGKAKEALIILAGPSSLLCVGGLISVLAGIVSGTREKP